MTGGGTAAERAISRCVTWATSELGQQTMEDFLILEVFHDTLFFLQGHKAFVLTCADNLPIFSDVF